MKFIYFVIIVSEIILINLFNTFIAINMIITVRESDLSVTNVTDKLHQFFTA